MLNLSEIIQLKQALAEKRHVELHFHDVCPQPFFTLERSDSEIRNDIADFLEKKRYSARFSDDGLQFTVEKKSSFSA